MSRVLTAPQAEWLQEHPDRAGEARVPRVTFLLERFDKSEKQTLQSSRHLKLPALQQEVVSKTVKAEIRTRKIAGYTATTSLPPISTGQTKSSHKGISY